MRAVAARVVVPPVGPLRAVAKVPPAQGLEMGLGLGLGLELGLGLGLGFGLWARIRVYV